MAKKLHDFCCFQILEFARDGNSIESVIEKGKKVLGRKLVQSGVDLMIKELIVDATFADGLKRLKIQEPICNDLADFELTFYGSFLPTPNIDMFTSVNKTVQISQGNDIQMANN